MDWVISDVHGAYYTLLSLIDRVKIIDSSPNFIFLGDYVDRGLNSKEVIDFLISFAENNNVTYLTGNHDDVVSYILNEDCKSSPEVIKRDVPHAFIWWKQNGLIQTLESYGVYDNSNSIEQIEKFKELVPESHKKFLMNLQLYWSSDTHFACHGFMRPYEDLPRDFKFMKRDRTDETLWSRFEKSPVGGINLIKPCSWDKIGIFGHTPTKVYGSNVPIVQDKIRLIDTGVFLDNYLTAYCCQKDEFILQPSDSKDFS